MVFQVGVIPFPGKIAAYNTDNKELIKFNINEVKKSDITTIEKMFEQIKIKLGSNSDGTNFGCFCICLESDCDNEFRQKILDCGKQLGFIKTQIINWDTLIFLDSIIHSEYKFHEEDIIWIFKYGYFNIWKKTTTMTKYKMIKCILVEDPLNKESLLKVKSDSGIKMDPNLIIYDKVSKFDGNMVESIFPKCKIIAKEATPFDKIAEMVLIKARIIADDPEVNEYDTDSHLTFDFVVHGNGRHLGCIKEGEALPLEKKMVIPIIANEICLKIQAGRVIDQHYIIKIFTDEIKNTNKMSKIGKILVNFKIDINRICSLTYTIPNEVDIKELEEIANLNIKDDPYCIDNKSDDEEEAKEDEEDEEKEENIQRRPLHEDWLTIKKTNLLFFKQNKYILAFMLKNKENIASIHKSWHISFTEQKPIIGQDAREILKEKPSFVVYDLIKVCSITDPIEADPEWLFSVKKDINNKMIVEFDTLDGRKAATPVFLMALVFRDIKNLSKKMMNERLDKFLIKFCDFERNNTLVRNILEAAKLVNVRIDFG